MKILGISLLRLGDIFIHLPALQSLKAKYPEAEIHVLLNKQFTFVQPLLAGVDVIHEFDRARVQQTITDPRLAITNAFSMVRDQVTLLNEIKFDLVVNLTHTRLSALIAGRVNAARHEGMVFQEGAYRLAGSKWWRELSHHNRNEACFTFTQILDYAVGGSGRAQLELNVSDQARTEANRFLVASTPTHISVQVQTSDAKKSMDLTKAHALLVQLDQQYDNIQFTLLCAPNEIEQIQPLAEGLAQEGLRVSLAPVSLGAALAIIEDTDLLVTTDTSIKHLARATATPILEVALGSSAPRETGSVRPGDFIVQSRELCSPCKHSEDCYRSQRFCSDRISATALAEICVAMLAKDELRILEIANRSRRNFRVFGTLGISSGLYLYELEAGQVGALQRMWDSELWCTANAGALPPETTSLTDGSMERLIGRLEITPDHLFSLGSSLIEETDLLEKEVGRTRENLLCLGLSLQSVAPESLTKAELKSLMASLLGLIDSSNFLKYFRAKIEALTEITPATVAEVRGVLGEIEVMCRLRRIQLSEIQTEGGVASVQY